MTAENSDGEDVGGHRGASWAGQTNLVTETRAGQAQRLADPPMNYQHPCDVCGWSGPRRRREVNFSAARRLWLCARCFRRARRTR